MAHSDYSNAPTGDPSRAPPMGAAAHLYESIQPSTTPTSVQRPAPQPIPDTVRDTVMTDGSPARAASPSVNPNAPSPHPPRTTTPMRNTNGSEMASRATSQHPEMAAPMPSKAQPHGAPVRQYLNGKVTGPLLEGMKLLAKDQPKDPLRVLGEYLLQRSKEVEGT